MPSLNQPYAGRRVLLYSGEDPKAQSTTMFYLNLFWRLITLGREKGIEIVPFIDTRPMEQRVIRPPELKDTLEDMHLDGVIGILIHKAMTAWMAEAHLPFSALTESAISLVRLDYLGMISTSFRRLAELGCRSVGLMFPANNTQSVVFEHVEKEAKALNLEVKYEWILMSRQSLEIAGYNHFLSLWDLKAKPDGLVVHPDETARGVISAIVEKQIQVPGELKLVIHRNAESPFFVPFCCDYMENSVTPLAHALFENLEASWAGQEQKDIRVPFHLVKGY
ncbi:MAG: substrate-binding domain-containing protein [Chthoniobacteraceae bacterium]